MRFFLTLSILLNISLGALSGYLIGRQSPALEISRGSILGQEPALAVAAAREHAEASLPKVAERLQSGGRLSPAVPQQFAPAPPVSPTVAISATPVAPSEPPQGPTIVQSRVLPSPEAAAGVPKRSAPLAQPAPLQSGAAAPRVVAQAYHSSAPGNSFLVQGARVALAETYDSDGTEGRAMAIDITPSDEGGAEIPSASDTLDAAGNSPARSRKSGKSGASANVPDAGFRPAAGEELQANGMTAEEELFRMKWGWAAFDAARAAALREARP